MEAPYDSSRDIEHYRRIAIKDSKSDKRDGVSYLLITFPDTGQYGVEQLFDGHTSIWAERLGTKTLETYARGKLVATT